jgi:hypothetical protein
MSKMSPKKIQKLIQKNRVVPVIQINEKGESLLYGYRRKNNRSSKSNENYMFAEPIKLDKPVDNGI